MEDIDEDDEDDDEYEEINDGISRMSVDDESFDNYTTGFKSVQLNKMLGSSKARGCLKEGRVHRGVMV